jgi:hypothetical protein
MSSNVKQRISALAQPLPEAPPLPPPAAPAAAAPPPPVLAPPTEDKPPLPELFAAPAVGLVVPAVPVPATGLPDAPLALPPLPVAPAEGLSGLPPPPPASHAARAAMHSVEIKNGASRALSFRNMRERQPSRSGTDCSCAMLLLCRDVAVRLREGLRGCEHSEPQPVRAPTSQKYLPRSPARGCPRPHQSRRIEAGQSRALAAALAQGGGTAAVAAIGDSMGRVAHARHGQMRPSDCLSTRVQRQTADAFVSLLKLRWRWPFETVAHPQVLRPFRSRIAMTARTLPGISTTSVWELLTMSNRPVACAVGAGFGRGLCHLPMDCRRVGDRR